MSLICHDAQEFDKRIHEIRNDVAQAAKMLRDAVMKIQMLSENACVGRCTKLQTKEEHNAAIQKQQ